jgi:hypothetical protein
MEEDNTQYYCDEWNIENPVFINGIEQINIGTIDKSYYMPKLTKEEIIHCVNRYKQNTKDADKYTK